MTDVLPALRSPAARGREFLSGCGQPLQGQEPVEPAQFETCEIMGRWKSGLATDTYHFSAEAVGPHGPHIAAQSREWKELAPTPRWKVLDSTHAEADAILKELISALVKDGWEPVEERGTNWENFRFRRQVE